ncbi:hypothetical protein NEPAR06_1456 [Nematocida parisii]|uniref:Uncharacterized protein n=1 Tax=Nematocida parisii (strain ERTm3) TaxID=935791 RepID=I3EIQ8_NEMP3|nr:uncharacterized protein NEPG_01683 [Nematocida parisii ERTm1]EIJ89105.1 hypothetical protein NEQG_00924 [Nematocida parisii ERTm3]KAI5125882.1 hypothetical protein NEPAR08_0218 [Nematocida parisii]EIJ93341.1 hypothetical protein NEPG_01683 [Nematocida parisii ERTm1]KAI5126147.1 hypothetical protein NEPAR03_0319 [Nematocida parisii]KAI5145446.1 hypothetical protein NEPAR07_1688 [Nematocida parisii]|eukprot:XP_013059511.1 hypothetical protein NEPG_01683 [Nematocida parisii ERTm1]
MAEGADGSKKKKIIIVAGIVAALIVAGGVIFFICKGKAGDPSNENSPSGEPTSKQGN